MTKDITIKIRLTEELNQMLIFKSKAINTNKSEYLRKLINSSDIKVANSKDKSNIIKAVNKVGNNINQIAYMLNKANLNNELNKIDYDNLSDKLSIIEYMLNEIK